MKQLTAATGLAAMLVLFAYPMPAAAQQLPLVPEACQPVEVVREVIRVVPSIVPGPVQTVLQPVPGPTRTVTVPGPVETVFVPGPVETVTVTEQGETIVVPSPIGQPPLPSATLTPQPAPTVTETAEPVEPDEVVVTETEAAGISLALVALGVSLGVLGAYLIAKYSRKRAQRQEARKLADLKQDLFSKE